MGSDAGSKIFGAVAGAITIEWMDKALDEVGLTEENAHLARVVIKAAASAVVGIVAAAILDGIMGSDLVGA